MLDFKITSELQRLHSLWFSIFVVFIGLNFCSTARSMAQTSAIESTPIDFAHDILPILKENCAECHTNGVYKGGLSFDTRGSLLDSGAVDVDSHRDSDLFDRIVSHEEDYRMPPEGSRLTAAQVRKMARWIDEGLKWPTEISLRKKTFRRSLNLSEVELPDTTGHPIDSLIEQYFKDNSIEPPAVLSDREFIRRAKLDLLGLLPTPEEIHSYVHRRNKGKEAELVAIFLNQKRDYADHWISLWNDLLRNDYAGTGYIDGGRKQITQWLHRSLVENKPYHVMVQELISPSPESEGFIKGIKWRGRVNASQIQALQFSQNVSQVFLGINMKCASCHDSFIDDWKLEDAYGLAAVSSESPLEIHRCDVPTGKTAKSKFVFPTLGTIDHGLPKPKRLSKLATLITHPANGRFSRTIVNRLWQRMMGRGLVHPIDVMANRAWSETLLDFLARDLIDHQYDLKRTMRLIATSRIYRSESVAVSAAEKSSSEFVFRGVLAKRMTAEQFVDSVWNLSGAGPSKPDANIATSANAKTTLPGQWIWNSTPARQAPADQTVYFRREFALNGTPEAALLVASCDNELDMWLNGKHVLTSREWDKPASADLTPHLIQGKNVVIARGGNAGSGPNPAGFYAWIQVRTNMAKENFELLTDDSWEVADRPIPPMYSSKTPVQKANWTPANEIANAWEIYGGIQNPVSNIVKRWENPTASGIRASLVKADLLMRSLGRPNREQVVTTRPDSLSTLQALDLSNGETLARWLKQGANRWSQLQTKWSWTNEQLIQQIFEHALSREPTTRELSLMELPKNEPVLESLEDLLWTVVMLPEFQLIQ